jgi:hypothetical protein
MRPDMFKVIVERPRGYKDRDRSAAARLRDWDGPMFLGMRVGRYVHLNENLSPLRRFLRAQRGRPWDKVLSELSATIDTRSTVKRHILEHLDDFVATRTWLQDTQIWFADRGVPAPLARSRKELYVDPRTGILRENAQRRTRTERRSERERAEQAEHAHRRILSATEQLHAIDGIWYHVAVATLPPIVPSKTRPAGSRSSPDGRWDALRCA